MTKRLWSIVLVFLVLCNTSMGQFDSTWNELTKRAYKYIQSGEFNKAKATFDQAFEHMDITPMFFEESIESDLTFLLAGGVVMTWIGCTIKLGDFDEALPVAAQLVSVTRKRLGESHVLYGGALNLLGSVYDELGRYEASIEIYKKALSATQNVRLAANLTGTILSNLGVAYLYTGHFDEAIETFEKGLIEIEKTVGRNHPSYALILGNIASCYSLKSEYHRSIAYSKEAIGIYDSLAAFEPALIANEYMNLGSTYEALEMDSSALQCYQTAKSGFESGGYQMSDGYRINLMNLMLLKRKQGDYRAAVDYLIGVNKIIAGQIDKAFSVSGQKSKFDYLKKIRRDLNEFHSLSFDVNYNFDTLNGLHYNNALKYKGNILRSFTGLLNGIQHSSDKETQMLFNDWVNLRSILSSQQNIPLAQRRINQDSIVNAINVMENKLVVKSSKFADFTQLITWRDIAADIPSNSCAIEFVHFNYYGPSSVVTDSILYVAMLIKKGIKQPITIPICEERRLLASKELLGVGNNNINALYRGAQALNSNAVSENVLYDEIWKPLEPFLDNIEVICFSPSGILNQISLSAIPHPSGGTLSDYYDLIQLSSTRNLLAGADEPGTASISMFGAVEYEFTTQLAAVDTSNEDESLLAVVSDSDQRSALLDKFTYLPGTESEVQQIQSLFEQNQSTTNLLTGQSATEASFKSLSGNSPDVIHIATHGFFFPDVEYTAEEIERGAAFKYIDNPMFRAGLAFAGANYTWEHGYNPFEEEDGILTAYEISNMDLSNTDLVVLSACETGLGEIKGSEGVFGLQRAFKMAGVDYLMMSLWQVPDKETSEFMVLFYENWLGGMEIREAFRETQLAMSERYEGEPYKWAAFVLVE